MNIYVGNLSYETGEDALQELFANYGQVLRAKVIMDRETGRSRGFAFVDMADAEGGQQAIEALDGFEFEGRPLRVREAEPRAEGPGGGGRPRFGGGGGGPRGGGGGGGFSRGGPRGGGGGPRGGGGGGRGGPDRRGGDRKRRGFGDDNYGDYQG